MKVYGKYKDSGNSWIGKIPANWELTKAKYCSSFRMGQTILKEDVNEDGEFPVYSATEGDHYFGRINNPSFVLEPGDIVIPARGNSIGHIALVKERAVCTQTTIASFIERQKINSNFLYYFYKGFRNTLFHYDATAIPQITVDQVKQNPIVLPTLSEQTKIAQYLDHQTTIIDQLILQKEKLIELLKEKRQAVINEAVTKGLNPNAKMKDSGIEWLGEVPEDWEVGRFNRYVFLKHGFQFRDYDFTDDGIKVVKITQLKADGTLDVSNASFIDKNRIGEFSDIVIEEGDILMALTGGTIGKIIRVAKVDEVLLQNYRVGKFIPANNKLSKEFLFWVLSSVQIQYQIFFAQRETGQPNIGKEDFGKMIFTLPPFAEQIQIFQFIENSIKTTSELIGLVVLEIEKLKEYRQSIISEAVTGKIDVRDWQPKNPHNN